MGLATTGRADSPDGPASKIISRLVRNPFRLAYEIAAAFWLRVAFNLKTRYGFDS
jgi:hypothetical protein